MAKDLKYFMRKRDTEIITVPGPENMLDDNGERIGLELRILDNATIEKIYDNYRRRSIALDKHGAPYIAAGEVVFKTEKDNSRAMRHVIAEALVYPDLKNKELMAFHDCHDITEMPRLVFSRTDEYKHVVRVVLAALGLSDAETEENTLESAKN
jgi:uncharacterized protein (DUF1330 family)